MAESISSYVKRIVDRSPFLHEMLEQEILSYSNYAEKIKGYVEKLCGHPVKEQAIVMALRRYGAELRKKATAGKAPHVEYQIVMKTNIYDINLVRNDEVFAKIGQLYSQISPEKGDFLNISLGNHEMSLAVSEKYRDAVEKLTAGEEVLHKMDNLVALTLEFSGDFLQTPGIVYEAVRRLAWEEINVIEIISTMNELSFVVSREDSMTAFDVLQSFLSNPDMLDS